MVRWITSQINFCLTSKTQGREPQDPGLFPVLCPTRVGTLSRAFNPQSGTETPHQPSRFVRGWPPRAWGRLLAVLASASLIGNTPTCVGKTRRRRQKLSALRFYRQLERWWRGVQYRKRPLLPQYQIQKERDNKDTNRRQQDIPVFHKDKQTEDAKGEEQ